MEPWKSSGENFLNILRVVFFKREREREKMGETRYVSNGEVFLCETNKRNTSYKQTNKRLIAREFFATDVNDVEPLTLPEPVDFVTIFTHNLRRCATIANSAGVADFFFVA